MVKKNKSNTQNKVIVKSAPAAVGTKIAANKSAKISMGMDGTTTISHMEYLGDVYGNNQEAYNKVYAVNPQRTSAFPWLSAIASRFETYKFEKLVYHYKPSSGTATQGYVTIGFDFDFYDATPTKAEVLTWKYSTKAAVWQPTSLSVSQDARLAIWKYTDYGSRADARLDMLGNLFISSIAGIDTGSSVTIPIGELFVEYVVKFKIPSYKLPPALYGTSVLPISSTGFAPADRVGKYIDNTNMLVKWISQNVLEFGDTGRFLVQIGQAAATGLTGAVAVLASPAVNSQYDKFNFTNAEQAVSSENSIRSIILDVLSGAVRLSLTANNNTGFGVVRIGTYIA